jgi:hypothetical protein
MLMACEPWIQFPNGEWDKMLEEVFQEMVDLWNEKNDARIAAEAIIESDGYGHPVWSLAELVEAAWHTADRTLRLTKWVERARPCRDDEEYAKACKFLTEHLDDARKTFLVAETAVKIALKAFDKPIS